MRQTFVVAEEGVAGHRADGDTALDKLVLGPHTGSARLEQHVTRYEPGRSLPRAARRPRRAALRGLRRRDARARRRAPRARAGLRRVRQGRRALRDRQPRPRRAARRLDHGPGRAGSRRPPRGDRPFRRPARAAGGRQAHLPLPRQPGRGLSRRDAVHRHRPALPRARPQPHATTSSATSSRARGSPTSRATRSRSEPARRFHLPPQQVHCIENSGPGVMRILGVFHPSGDPASRSYEDNSQAVRTS